MTEAVFAGLTMENSEAIASQLDEGFSVLPHTVATAVMKGYAEGYLHEARNGGIEWKDAIFDAGVSLGHARVHAGLLDTAVEIGKGWYISNNEGWIREEFAELAIPAYIRGFNRAKQNVPQSLQEIIRQIYPIWFKEKFKLEYSDENIAFVLNPRPIVMPFDHFTTARDFVGGVVHFPAGLQRRVWGYMKAWAFPPTMWYSARTENDFENFVEARASSEGMTIEELVEETGCHEGTHTVAIDPAVKLAVSGEEHSWLTEGVAQYFGDRTNKSKLERMMKIPSVLEIADTAGKPVSYDGGLLLTMALATKLSGSSERISEGMIQIVKRIADRGVSVSIGHETKLSSPLELLYLIDPSLRDEEERVRISKLMETVRKEAII
jgi:hypothetical protein